MQLYHIVLANLKRRKAKMFFVLLGLMIGIATIVSVYGVVETMKIEMTKQVSEFGVNVVITPDSGGLTFSYGGITLPEIMYDVNQLKTEDLEQMGKLPSKDMIRVVAPKLIGKKSLETGQKLTIVGADLQEEFLIKPWLRLENMELRSSKVQQMGEEMDYEVLDLSREAIESLKVSNKEIIIGAELAKNLAITQGDTLTIEDTSFKVYAVLLESGTEQDQQVFMNLAAAQDLLGRPNEITVIEMAVDYFLGKEELLLAEISEKLPHANVSSLRQETLRQDEMLGRLIRFGTALSAIILLIGMLVVALTMLSAIRERTREIGIFRALGFRKKHITQIILLEGAIVSVIGGLIGFVVGMLIAAYVGPVLLGAKMQIAWRLDLLFISVTLSVIIGLLSSIYPAHKAANLDPVQALRFI